MKWSGILCFLLIFTACTSSSEKETENRIVPVQKNDLAEYNLSGRVHRVLVATYNAIHSNGKIIKGSESDWNNAFGLQYSPEGKLVSLTEYIRVKQAKSRAVIDTVTWRIGRDAEGLRTSLTGYDHKGRFRGVYTYTNTPSGKEIQTKSYNYDSSLGYILDHAYNDKDQLRESVKSSKTGTVLAKMKYVYDDSGRLIDFSETNSHDIVMYRNLKKYNQRGLLASSEETVRGNKSKIRYEYEYDSRGNYIRQITFINEQPSEIEERTISYYP